MNKNIFPIIAIAIMMFFGACSNEVLLPEAQPEAQPEAGRTISLTASMPKNPTTRVELDQNEDLSISFKWEENDKLELALVKDGQETVKQVVDVNNISPDGRSAQFNVTIPEGFESGNFDLYGVYGGGGLDDETPTNVILPDNPGEATSLEDVDVMFYFASKSIDATNPEVAVNFKHLGSLFSIKLKNTSQQSLDNLYEAQLVGVNNSGNEDWAYNSDDGGKIYDLLTDEFQEPTSGGNSISFKSSVSSLPAGEEMSFWGWYPPLPNKNWPELKLDLRNTTGSIVLSENSKDARTSETAVGRSYYFVAKWDGSILSLNPTVEVKLPIINRFAKMNVGLLNTFAGNGQQATVAEQQSKQGSKYYQWGRNIPFNDESQASTAIPFVESPSDPNVWSDKFILWANQGDGAVVENWYNGGLTTDTWESVVAQTQLASAAPTDYSGTNNGDPCPPGYRIPTVAEMLTLFPSKSGGPFAENNRSERVSTSFDGKTQSLMADYGTKNGIQYALKLKDSEYTFAVRYNYLSDEECFEVVSKNVDSETTINDVMTDGFFTDDDNRIFLPSTGYIFNQNGLKRDGNFYWTNSIAYGIDHVHVLSFGSTNSYGKNSNRRGCGYPIRCIRSGKVYSSE